MSIIETQSVSDAQANAILSGNEGHYLDFKAKEIRPATLSKTLSAFANTDGGEVYVGVDDKDRAWRGFTSYEEANPYLQVFEGLFPLGQDFGYSFVQCDGRDGFLLHVRILKCRDIRGSSGGAVYIRRGAQNLKVEAGDQMDLLKKAKGITSHETATLSVELDVISNSIVVIEFSLQIVPESEPLAWLRKQQLVVEGKPTVAGILLYADEPQAYLPKAAIKLYRYTGTAQEGARETLSFTPITIEGCLYKQIRDAVDRTVRLIEDIQIVRSKTGFETIAYPRETLHEIITNAVLHRDYSISDDIHIRIFDNRVEVESPGRLPGHITPKNILNERFARNGVITRLINKFPEPPNKDVGEGLNTAFAAMRKLQLKEPAIKELDHTVLVSIKHEALASPETMIVEYLKGHGTINNSRARDVTKIESEIQMRKILKKLVQANEIEQVPGTSRGTSAYRIKTRD